MSENIRWRVTAHPDNGEETQVFEHEPFAMGYSADGTAYVFTKEPFFDETTHRPEDTPRETQIFPTKRVKGEKKGKK